MRSTFLYLMLVVFLVACDSSGDSDNFSDIPDISLQFGEVTVSTRDNVRIHSYVTSNPEQMTSVVLELPNELVILDLTIDEDFAADVMVYADELEKPINRIILSHAHLDHYGGDSTFINIPYYAAPDVVPSLSTPPFGQLALPVNALQDTEEIDGINFSFETIPNTEADFNTVVLLPDQEIAYLNDMAYNRVHLVLFNNQIANWISALEDLKTQYSNYTIISGHGGIGGTEMFDENTEYLQFAQSIVNTTTDPAAFTNMLVERYPDWTKPGIVDFSNQQYWGANN